MKAAQTKCGFVCGFVSALLAISCLPAQSALTVRAYSTGKLGVTSKFLGKTAASNLPSFNKLGALIKTSVFQISGSAWHLGQMYARHAKNAVSIWGIASYGYTFTGTKGGDTSSGAFSLNIELLSTSDGEVELEFFYKYTTTGTGGTMSQRVSISQNSGVPVLRRGTIKYKYQLKKGRRVLVPIRGSYSYSPKGSGKGFGMSLTLHIGHKWSPYKLGLTKLGTGCGGKFAIITPPENGKTMILALQSAPAKRAAIMLIGDGRNTFGPYSLPLDLKIFGASGCLLQLNPLVTFPAMTDALGEARLSFLVPANMTTNFVGEVRFQWGFASTKNALGMELTEAQKLVLVK